MRFERILKILSYGVRTNQDKRWPNGPLGSYADFTSSSELLFASFSERVFVQNVSHENDLIFMRMNVQMTNIFIQMLLSS